MALPGAIAVTWPKDCRKAEVVFIHGIQSHGGWYECSSKALCRAGFNVYFLDRRGSGLNEKNRGDAPSFRRLLDDLAEFLTLLTRSAVLGDGAGRLPVFLAGISWGGKLAVALEATRHPGLVDGLALLCPGFYPKIYPTIGQRLLIVLCRFFRPRKLFPIPLNEAELFTANPAWQQFLRDDPLRLRQATARLLLESARLECYLRFGPEVRPCAGAPAPGRARPHHPQRQDTRFRWPLRHAGQASHRIRGAHHTLEFEPDPDRFIRGPARLVGTAGRGAKKGSSVKK